MTSSATTPALPSRRLGVIGSLVGMLALIAAVLPHWVVPVIFPPPPAEQVIVDTGHRIKDRLIARAKGVEYQAPKPEKSAGSTWSEMSSAAAISLGLLAIALAVLALLVRHGADALGFEGYALVEAKRFKRSPKRCSTDIFFPRPVRARPRPVSVTHSGQTVVFHRHRTGLSA
jgi:hypothetical protein